MKDLIQLFKSTNFVCHYTKPDNLPLILSNGFRFNRLSEMNDVFESTKRIYFDSDSNDIITEEEVIGELNRYYQISFSNDSSDKRAFMLWQMWGHYAKKGNGVCIVVDKDELVNIILNSQYRYEDIRYIENEYGNVIIDQEPLQFFENSSNIFFEKNKDWEHEREFRIISRFKEHSDHFIQCLEAIKCVITLKEQTEFIIKTLQYHNIPLLLLSNFLGNWQLTDCAQNLIWSQISLEDYNISK